MPNDKKIKKVEEYKKIFDSNNFFISLNPSGTTVSMISDFRKEIVKIDATYKVIKNSLALIAAKELNNDNFNELISGPTSILATNADPMLLTKLVYKYKNEIGLNFLVKNGYFEGAIVDEKQLNEISKLPSKEELISKLLMLISSPINRLVFSLKYPIYQFTNTLKAIKSKAEESKAIKSKAEEPKAEEPKAEEPKAEEKENK